jgi:hypothetical protein
MSIADAQLSPVPDLAALRARLSETFVFEGANGATLNATLVDVHEQPAMNSRFACFAAQFALPFGTAMHQGLYTVRAGEDRWAWLLTPVMPGEDGRPRMEAVFHVLSQSAETPHGGAQQGRAVTHA